MARLRIAVAQLCSSNDKARCMAAVAAAVAEAASTGAKMVFLPECFAFMGCSPAETVAAAEPLSGPTLTAVRDLAKRHSIWISAGGFHEQGGGAPEGQGPAAAGGDAAPPARIFNTHVVIGSSGAVVASYRKAHLFDVELPTVKLQESASTVPGSRLVAADTPVGRLGLSTCYDLRFPAMYERLRFQGGCTMLTVPSAFTVPTGRAHWEVLLRARAIETQCVVVAAAQVGSHNGGVRETYGHSMVVAASGEVVGELGGSEPGLLIVDVDCDPSTVRERMPLEQHRRPELYTRVVEVSSGEDR